jgi:hypothetical protein
VTALRELAGQTRAALTARRDGPHQHPITDLVTSYSGAEFVNHSHRLVTDDKSALDWILSADNVQIGSANRRQGDTNYRFATPARGRSTSSTRMSFTPWKTVARIFFDLTPAETRPAKLNLHRARGA